MNYDEMRAGPELDRLIAEKVMDWLITTDPFGVIKAGCNRYIVSHDIEQGDLEDLTFKPSVNIAHAWEVVARLQWGFKGKRQLYLQTDGYSSEQWRASWHRPEEYVTQAEVEADTAPLAICRAALKAVTQ